MTLSNRRFWIVLVAGVAALIALAFGRVLFFDFAPVDDHDLIVQNVAIRQPSLASFGVFFTHYDPELYIPLTYVSYFIDHLIFGIQPWGFHLHNLLLHTLNALLVAVLLRKLTGSRLLSACAALLFAVHPLQTEAVVWIAARKDLLASFFALVSALFFLHAEEQEQGLRRWYMAGILAFVLGLLAKVTIVGLPLLFVFLTGSLRKAVPFWIASIIFAIVAIVGKADVLASVDPLQRIFLTLYGMGTVFIRMVVPLNMAVMYDPPDPSIATVSIALIVPVLLLLAWTLRRKVPLFTIGIAWILIFLFPPTLNAQADALAPGATFAADRYGYLPSIGLLIALAGLLQYVLCAETTNLLRKNILSGVVAAVVILFIILSRAQASTWSSPKAVFVQVITATPSSADAHVALARILRREGKLEEAFAVLKDALPYGQTKDMLLEAGSIYAAAGQIEDAAEQFRKVIELYPDQPEPSFALGELAMHAGDAQSALAFYEQAIALEPRYGKALARKAAILQERGDTEEAERILQDVLVWDPENLDVLLSLIDLYRLRGADPLVYIERVTLLYPDHPDAGTGSVFAP